MKQPDRTDIERIQGLIGQRYQLSWIIGRGGMSTVWLALDTQTEHDVAIKVLKPEYTDNAEFRSRFRNEAETSEIFQSENVVRTYDYSEVSDPITGTTLCFMVMEYIRGESLADVLSRERNLPPKLAVDVMAQVALGLQTIHSHHLVHRDIKPGNLLITPDGLVKVTDFGIAKAAAAVPLTQTGMVVGTAQYVSPEQAQGQNVGPASDIYSLGVVAYEMLAGRRPFSGESTVSVAIKHISNAPPPLPAEIPGALRELVGICLRKNPRARYADGAELASAIQRVVEGERPPQPHAVPPTDVDSQPFTEQLGQVSTGSGTSVPPRQGPAEQPERSGAAAPVPAGAGAGARGASGTRTHAATPAASAQNAQKKGNGTGPLVALGAVAVLALGALGYLFFTGNDQSTPDPETLTVTNEVTTESTPPPNTTTYTQPSTSDSEPSPTSETRTSPETTEPEATSSDSSAPSSSENPAPNGNSGNSGPNGNSGNSGNSGNQGNSGQAESGGAGNGGNTGATTAQGTGETPQGNGVDSPITQTET